MKSDKINKAYSNLRNSAKAAWEVLKNEGPETIYAGKLLLKLGSGKKLTSKERLFLKAQSADVGKMLGLFALFMVPGGSILVPIAAEGLKKLGIDPYPSSQKHLKEFDMLRTDVRKIIAEMLLKETQELRIPYDMDIPKDIWDLKRFFDQAGKKLYVVGGAIRDALTGKKIKDYDLATDATPEQMGIFIPSDRYTFLEAGNIFPVVHLVTPENGRYEIATFRVDVSDDETGGHRKPKTQFATIEQDVLRRDLTVNALFYDLDKKEIVDLVGGISDIQNNRVRTVGDPSQRFVENEIRKLRALRFAARMGSELDDSIKESLMLNPSLDTEAPEAVQAEFIKGLQQAKSVTYYMEMLFEFGLYKWVFKDLPVNKEYIREEKDPTILFASLVRDADPKMLRSYLKTTLKYSDDFAKRVMFFVMFQHFKPEDIMAFHKLNSNISKVSENDLLRAGEFMGYDQNMVRAFFEFEPISNSEELIARGLTGRALGDAIKQIEIDHFKSLL